LSVKAKLFHHDAHARYKDRPEDLLPLVESGDSCSSEPRGGHTLAPTTSEAPLFVFRTERFAVSRSLFFGGFPYAALRNIAVALFRPATLFW
jgi:hypothetical protein